MKSCVRTFVYLFICLFVYLSICPSPAFASDEFSTAFRSIYTVASDTQTIVKHQISLTNQRANTFASEYSLVIGSTTVGDIRVSDDKGNLPFTTEESVHSTKISVKLSQRPVVGTGATKTFTIQYQDQDIASLVGKILEVNIPKIANAQEFTTYETRLFVPKNAGPPTTVSPNPSNISKTDSGFLISFENNYDSGISAVFGPSQLFQLTLTYYLENKGLGTKTESITLVPDTAYQRVGYKSINPAPHSIFKDADGNWIASYKLAGKEKLKITASVIAELHMTSSIPINQDDPNLFLAPTQYWPADSPDIITLARGLRTPRAIYDYVVTHLSYDYSKVELGTDRLGARAALASPSKAICTEFTDLFITLARAAGIPARELNGFAYTKNSKLRPLSLERDILHAWPEYWNDKEKRWIQIDPTWGNTTGGIDYFTKLDFNHIVFVTHGTSSTLPLSAGFFKTDDEQGKTISVEPLTVAPSFEDSSNFSVTVHGPGFIPSFFGGHVQVELTNHTLQALYNLPITVNMPQLFSSEIPSSIPFILPGQQLKKNISLKPPAAWTYQKERIEITIGGKQGSYDVFITPPIISYQGGAVVFAVAAVISLFFAARARYLHLSRRS